MEWNSDPEGPPSWLNKPEPKRPGVKPWYPPAPKEKKATRASKVAVSTGEQACSRCEKAKPMSAYDKDKKGEYLKTCRACKEYQKAYAASKKAKVSKK